MRGTVFAVQKEGRKKLKKMELIYILNVMIIINDKFKVYTPTRREVRVRGKEGNLLRIARGKVLNVIVKL